MHADEIPFLNAIFQDPRDEVPRLIYADWLEERGDKRSALLRLELQWMHPIGKRKRRGLQRKVNKLKRNVDPFWHDLLHRSKRADVLRELISLDHGESVLEVLGGEAETAFAVGGKPFALRWRDDESSVSEFLLVTGKWNFQPLETPIQEFIAGNIVLDLPLSEQLRPLLSVFANGLYEISYTPSRVVFESPSWGQVILREDLQNYLPQNRILICTQPRNHLRVDRIDDYRMRILKGWRPIVVTTSARNAACEFVIAGHEELDAYFTERVPPSILRIDRCNAPPITLQMGLEFLPKDQAAIAEYRRVKERTTQLVIA